MLNVQNIIYRFMIRKEFIADNIQTTPKQQQQPHISTKNHAYRNLYTQILNSDASRPKVFDAFLQIRQNRCRCEKNKI